MKPDFFKNEQLAALKDKAKLLFIGLWCMADREGRLEDRPKRIEAEIFPYQKVNADRLLADLSGTKDPFIRRYQVGEFSYIEIINFRKHQNPHPNERPSEIPKFVKCNDTLAPKNEGLGLNPSSLNPSSLNHESRPPRVAHEILDHFNTACGKNLTLTPERKTLIEKRLAEGRTPEELKTAISNFAKDDWPDRHKYMDLVYVIGVRNKIDNLDKWLNYEPSLVSSGGPSWMNQ